MSWQNLAQLDSRTFICGYCNNTVASDKGYFSQGSDSRLYICPHCKKPSFFKGALQIPGVASGKNVLYLPENIEKLYEEARNCIASNSYTGAVLLCRKLLMNIAVELKAKEGESFLTYVSYLADKGYVPPNGKGWVDHIRKKGNEANHEIVLMSVNDAEELLQFSEMLLRFIYEFPNRIPKEVVKNV